jgi:hypothetical protein
MRPRGISQIVLRATPQLAKMPGGSIGLSIRARKPGDDVLTGVTAERLAKLPVSH